MKGAGFHWAPLYLECEEVEREVPGGDEPGHAHRVSAGDVDHARPAHCLGGVHQTLPRMRELDIIRIIITEYF